MRTVSPILLRQFEKIAGARHILTDPILLTPYSDDATPILIGKPAAV